MTVRDEELHGDGHSCGQHILQGQEFSPHFANPVVTFFSCHFLFLDAKKVTKEKSRLSRND
jgi:hypothetical protein